MRVSSATGSGRATRLTAPDGQLDATFKVTVESGSGARTVTQLELWTLNGSGRWDTITTTTQWMVGAANGLDSTLHNASNGTVSFATTDGQSFYLFAPDLTPSLFTPGVQVRVQARLADGTTATADTTLVAPQPPTLTLGYEGKQRDRVGKGNSLTAPDGQLDATFKVTVESGSGPRTVTQLELWTLNGSGRWDTITTTTQWMVGAANGLDSTLHNASNGTVSFATTDGQSFYLFAPDLTPSVFTPGVQVRVQARLADGTTATADTTLGTPPSVTPPSLSGVSPQQGTIGQTLGVTLTGSNFQAGATVSFGAGTSVSATNVGSPTSITATLAIAPNATAGPRNVIVVNPDGGSATLTNGFTIATPPPPSLSLGYEGKQRDRVGKGNSLTAPGRPAGRHLQGHRRVRQRPPHRHPARALDTERQRSLGHHHDHYPMDGRCRQRARQHPPQRQQRHCQLCHQQTDRASTSSPPTSPQASSPPASRSASRPASPTAPPQPPTRRFRSSPDPSAGKTRLRRASREAPRSPRVPPPSNARRRSAVTGGRLAQNRHSSALDRDRYLRPIRPAAPLGLPAGRVPFPPS